MADVLESLIRYSQAKLTEELKEADDKTMAIACAGLFRVWEPGAFKTGDIRVDPDTGYPLECMNDHDSNINTDWTIDTTTCWKPYHSRSAEWALPWEQPTGAHDMYKAGEYMIWTDGNTYQCTQDTNFSPTEYAQAWDNVEGE